MALPAGRGAVGRCEIKRRRNRPPRRNTRPTALGMVSTSTRGGLMASPRHGHFPVVDEPGSFQCMKRGASRAAGPGTALVPAIPIVAAAGFGTVRQGTLDHCCKRLRTEEESTACEARCQWPEDRPEALETVAASFDAGLGLDGLFRRGSRRGHERRQLCPPGYRGDR